MSKREKIRKRWNQKPYHCPFIIVRRKWKVWSIRSTYRSFCRDLLFLTQIKLIHNLVLSAFLFNRKNTNRINDLSLFVFRPFQGLPTKFFSLKCSSITYAFPFIWPFNLCFHFLIKLFCSVVPSDILPSTSSFVIALGPPAICS